MYIFTPHAVANLAELGAEVIKIEMPRMGDAMRHTSPFNEAYLYPLHDTRPMTGTGLGYTNANANKYFVTMDYHVPEMKEAVLQPGETDATASPSVTGHGTFDRWKQSYRVPHGDQPPVHLRLGRRLRLRPQDLRRLLRHPGAGPRRPCLRHRHPRVHGRPLHQGTNWVIDWYSGTQITVRHPGGHALSPKDRARHHDRVLPGAGGHPLPGLHHAAVRQVRHRPPALGQLGHPAVRARHHHVPASPTSRMPKTPRTSSRPATSWSAPSRMRTSRTCATSSRSPTSTASYKAHKERVGGRGPGRDLQGHRGLGRRQEPVRSGQDPERAGLLAEPVMNDREVYEMRRTTGNGARCAGSTIPLFGDILVQSGYSCRPDVQDPQEASTGTGVRWARTTSRSTTISSASP